MEGPRFVRCSSVDGRWAAAALGRCERGAVGVAVSCPCESGFSVPWAYTQECSCWVVSWELCVQRFEEPGSTLAAPFYILTRLGTLGRWLKVSVWGGRRGASSPSSAPP